MAVFPAEGLDVPGSPWEAGLQGGGYHEAHMSGEGESWGEGGGSHGVRAGESWGEGGAGRQSVGDQEATGGSAVWSS